MKQFILQKQWLALPNETKMAFRTLFRIPKSSGTEVVNNVLVCDGSTNKDLENLSMSRMIEYLGPDCDFFSEDLFDNLFLKVLLKYGQIKKEPVPEPATTQPGIPSSEPARHDAAPSPDVQVTNTPGVGEQRSGSEAAPQPRRTGRPPKKKDPIS